MSAETPFSTCRQISIVLGFKPNSDPSHPCPALLRQVQLPPGESSTAQANAHHRNRHVYEQSIAQSAAVQLGGAHELLSPITRATSRVSAKSMNSSPHELVKAVGTVHNKVTSNRIRQEQAKPGQKVKSPPEQVPLRRPIRSLESQ